MELLNQAVGHMVKRRTFSMNYSEKCLPQSSIEIVMRSFLKQPVRSSSFDYNENKILHTSHKQRAGQRPY